MKIKGFTLIELLITIVILVGLSSMGIASYAYLIRKNEQQMIIDQLKTAVQYAKIQAITLGNPVYLAPLDTNLDWSNGAILYTFNKKTNKSELVYQWQWHHPQWSITWTGINFAHKIMFTNNPANAISNGHFTLVNFQTGKQTVIILNRLGRIRVTSQKLRETSSRTT